MWVNPQMGISGYEVYPIISKIGLKSHENQSAYIKNPILWVCRECQCGPGTTLVLLSDQF